MMNVLKSPATDHRLTIVIGLTFLLVIAAGFAAPSMPIVPVGIVGIAGVASLLTLGDRLTEGFLVSLCVLLTGYAFLGKGFAYVGIPPLYIGEAVLGLGVLALLASIYMFHIGSAGLLLLLFMVLGAIRTFPYLTTYGISAIRDAALWYYALFAIALSVLLERRHFERVVAWVSKIAPVLVIWLAITSLFGRFTLPGVPHFPGSPWPLFFVKPGDRGVMLVVTGAFVLVGLYHFGSRHRNQFSVPLWAIWLVGAASVTIMTRGGMLALGLAMSLIFFLRPTRQWIRPGMVTIIAIGLFIVIDPSIPSPYGGRTISVSQMTTNVTSMFSDKTTDEGYLDQNKNFRMEWWNAIWGYTVNGPYFLDGKGFGINLANADGFQIQADETLRSPHNAHLTILARMGVPGLLAWAAFHLTFLFQLIAAHRRSRARGDAFWANIDVWILSMWLAMMVNASFDVYFEGPQGGIWFWAVVGAGLAALRFQPPDDWPGPDVRAPAQARPTSAT